MIQQLMKYKEQEYEEKANKIYGVVTALVTNNNPLNINAPAAIPAPPSPSL